jgi:hypothetical protein
MSKNTRFLISTTMGIALLLIVLAGIAFAKAPEAGAGKATDNTPSIQATGVVVTTTGYMPKTITEFGTYTFTYPIALHYQISTPLTTTIQVTVTLAPYLDYVSHALTGTLLLPDHTLVLPENRVILTSSLRYCQPATLTVVARGTFDQGTLDLGIKALTTTVEWDGNRDDLVTQLNLYYALYLPIIVRYSQPPRLPVY